MAESARRGHFKDEILEDLSRRHNIAQFVSFAPGSDLAIRRCHIQATRTPISAAEAVKLLLERAPEQSVNIRSFDPVEPKSRDFIYGLKSPDEVLQSLEKLAASGLYTIVNETIDVHDGGISGVVVAGVCEFSPDDTPRCVEKAGTAAMSVAETDRLIETVYGFNPNLSTLPLGARIEFSVHPLRRGLRQEHIVVWEAEDVRNVDLAADVQWPNNFSRLIGDKTFGLLVAHLLDLPVPFTTVLTRRLPPFSFGRRTPTGEKWIRTAPREPVPGLFTTQKGWIDPIALWRSEDPTGEKISAVLAQDGVDSMFSGALVADADGTLTIEGVRGEGDEFMLGTAAPVSLPAEIIDGVRSMFDVAARRLGPVRMEWAFDGSVFWVLQLHVGATGTTGGVIFPGDPARVHQFRAERGIADLRRLVGELQGGEDGVVIVGNVGVTSHLGDILRRARIPSWIERPPVESQD